jgi:hypothetical protein
MNFFRAPEDSAALTIRGALLRRAIAKSLSRLVPEKGRSVVIEEEATDITGLCMVHAFASSRSERPGVFLGLVNAPQDMAGCNTLVVTRSLKAEVRAFFDRMGLAQGKRLGAARDILKGFDKVVVCDRGELEESLGFAPWAQIALVDQFLIKVEISASSPVTGNAVVFEHPGADPADVEATVRMASTLLPTTVLASSDKLDSTSLKAMQAPIHIHVGFSHRLPCTALSPLDSLVSGAYTAVVDRDNAGIACAGDIVLREVAARPYAKVVTKVSKLEVELRRLVQRYAAVESQGLQFNPEIQRFAKMNENLIVDGTRRLEEQVL